MTSTKDSLPSPLLSMPGANMRHRCIELACLRQPSPLMSSCGSAWPGRRRARRRRSACRPEAPWRRRGRTALARHGGRACPFEHAPRGAAASCSDRRRSPAAVWPRPPSSAGRVPASRLRRWGAGRRRVGRPGDRLEPRRPAGADAGALVDDREHGRDRRRPRRSTRWRTATSRPRSTSPACPRASGCSTR